MMIFCHAFLQQGSVQFSDPEMPSTGRHAARGSFRRANSRAEGQLYPVVPPVELEMENLEEQRVFFTFLLTC